MHLYPRLTNLISNPWLVLFISGISFGLSQLHQALWWGVPVGFVLFILGIWRLTDWIHVIWGGLLVGTLKSMGGFGWIWHAYPLVWLDINSATLQIILIGLYWLTTSLFMGLGIVLPALSIYYLYSRKWLSIIIFPAVWLIGEVLGSFVVSMWLLGPGSYLNIYIGHGYAGLPLAQFDWLLPFMAFGGLYGLTYVAALFGVLLVLVVMKNRVAYGVLSTLLVLIIAVHIFFPVQEIETTGAKIITVDTTFTATSQKTDSGRALKQQEVTTAIIAAASFNPDIILLPEDSRFSRQYAWPDEARKQLQVLIPAFEGLVVDTARIDTGEGAVLRAFYHDMSAYRTYITDKQFLVPQGEYVTYPFNFLLKILGQDEIIAISNQNQNYVPGPVSDYQNFPVEFPPLIFCFESSSILGVQRAVNQQNSPLVLHPISHSWFNRPSILEYQLGAMLKIQAVWSDVTIVTASNMTNGQLYLPSGEVDKGRVLTEGEYWSLVEYEI